MNRWSNIGLVAALLVASQATYATKARMQALGQDTSYGSLYFADSRSIFKNPAWLSKYSDMAVFETGAASNNADPETAPHAEGGIFKTIKGTHYGFYFGNEADAINASRQDAGSRLGEPAFLAKDNVMDFFIAGGKDFNWGANVQYSEHDDNQTTVTVKKEHSSLQVGVGALFERLEIYARAVIKDKNKGGSSATDEWERKLATTVGLNFVYKGNHIYIQYKGDAYKYVNANTAAVNYENRTLQMGWGKVKKVGKGARLFTDASLFLFREDFNNNTNIFKHKLTYFPITFGIEADARPWLVLRGSIQHRLLSTNKGQAALNDITRNQKKISTVGQTFVNAGASIKLGKVFLDGVIGTTSQVAARTVGAPSGVLNLDNLMSRFALMYFF